MTLIAAPPRCDANATGVSVTAWGFDSLPCQVRTGLRSFTDRAGTTRFYCGSLGHEADARRRFGEPTDAHKQWQIDAGYRLPDRALAAAVECADNHAHGCPCQYGGDAVLA